MRKLIYVPRAHDYRFDYDADDPIGGSGRKKLEAADTAKLDELIVKFWDDIQNRINQEKKIDKVYPEGLTEGFKVGLDLVTSKNHFLHTIIKLYEGGAEIRPSENKRLHDYREKIITETSRRANLGFWHFAQFLASDYVLRNLSDYKTAGLINADLKEDETGIAFFGAEHDIPKKLLILKKAKDIDVEVYKSKYLAEILSQYESILRPRRR